MIQYSILMVVDWSPEQGADLAKVDIPQDPKEMKRLVRRLRRVAEERVIHLRQRNAVLLDEAQKMSLGASERTRDVGDAAFRRLLWISDYRTRRLLFRMYWPPIRRYMSMNDEACLKMLRSTMAAHGWMAAMEGAQQDAERILGGLGKMPLY